MGVRQACHRYPRNCFACFVSGNLFQLCSSVGRGERLRWKRHAGGCHRQFLDLQAIPVLALLTICHDLWVASLPAPALTACWPIPPGISPYILCCSNVAVLPLSRQRSAVRVKRRLNSVPPLVVSSHHYHRTWCQHVAQSTRNTEIHSGSDSDGQNATLVPEPTSRIEGQWWHSGCLTPCSCVSAKDILVSWV